jgi:NTE family protein
MAWSIATLFELSRALDWDPRSAEVIVGTSAGSTLAMFLGASVSIDALLDASLAPFAEDVGVSLAAPPPAFPPWPRRSQRHESEGGFLNRFTRMTPLAALAAFAPEGAGDTRFLEDQVTSQLGGRSWVAHPGTRIVAMDVATGPRVAFGAPLHASVTMVDAVRASWAIPGWFPSVEIAGRRYVDGGVVSPASVDLAAAQGIALDEVIVLAPMSSPPSRRTGLAFVEERMRRHMRARLDLEVAEVEARGIGVIRLEPTPDDLEIIGANMMDGKRRRRVLEHALRSSRRNVSTALNAASRRPARARPTERRPVWRA